MIFNRCFQKEKMIFILLMGHIGMSMHSFTNNKTIHAECFIAVPMHKVQETKSSMYHARTRQLLSPEMNHIHIGQYSFFFLFSEVKKEKKKRWRKMMKKM